MSSIRVSFNSHEDLLFLGFNQDFSCFTCGTTSGYKICSTEPMRELGTGQLDDVGDESESVSSSKGLSITAIAMLEKSNILALVGNGSTFSRNKVVIWDHARNLTLATITFPSPVLNVLMHYHFLVVVLQFNTYVYLLSNLTYHSVYPTADNAAGLCAISTADSPMVLAVPLADPNPGVPVHIARYAAEIEDKVIRTHPTSYKLAQLALNRTGDKLATASENGVHIFVYDTVTMTQLKSFRRGNLSSNIFGIAFHPQDKYLCVCSDTGSAHIFDLQRTVSSSWFNPTSWIDPNGERSFAVIHYPDPSGRMPGQRLCCFGQTGNSVILLCADGTYVKFLFSADGTVVKDGTCSYFMPQDG